MGGTRMVDLSNPDSDPTVRKIVAEKFFGSGTGRYHSLTFVLLCRCVLMCVVPRSRLRLK